MKNKMMQRMVATIGLISLCATLAIGCAKKEPEVEEVAVVEEEPEEEPEPEPIVLEDPKRETLSLNENLLTGIDDLTDEAVGKRPIAVMVSNAGESLPQYGISQADVIFEMHVEGDMTRLMALYADYTQVPDIGSVRSCRYYFPAVALGFDAYYAHWGMDESIRGYYNDLDMDAFDGMVNTGGLFDRDQDRLNQGYGLEHTAYFQGTELVEALEELEVRTDLEEDKQQPAFLFNADPENPVKPDGEACTAVDIDFGGYTGQFEYDEESNTYLKSLNDKPQMDGVTDEQLAFTNVFVLETYSGVRENGVHKDIDWAGDEDSKGYYISNGAIQEIRWYKEDATESGYLKFFDTEGNELAINRGKSYIAYNYADQATFE